MQLILILVGVYSIMASFKKLIKTAVQEGIQEGIRDALQEYKMGGEVNE